MSRRATSASRPMRCGGRISSSRRRCPTRRRPARSTIPATSPAIWHAPRNSSTGRASASRAARSRRRRGKLRGIGLATYIEACGSNGPDAATVRLDRDGNVTVLVGIAIDRAGPQDRLCAARRRSISICRRSGSRVIQGDTDLDRLRRRHRRLELHYLRRRLGRRRLASSSPTSSRSSPPMCWRRRGSRPRDRRWRGARRRHRPRGLVRRSRGAPRASGRARCAAAMPLRPPQPTYPNGTHIAEVEIDPDTGATRDRRIMWWSTISA